MPTQGQKIDSILDKVHKIDTRTAVIEEKVGIQNGRVLRLEKGAIGLLMSVIGYLIYVMMIIIDGG